MNMMRKGVLWLSLIVLVAASLLSCDMVLGKNIKLDNQSDYDVSITLSLGQTNDDGSILWETKNVGKRSSVTVPTSTSYVTVKSWTPATVDCRLDSDAKTITFTNK
jgi:hypothetical protein